MALREWDVPPKSKDGPVRRGAVKPRDWGCAPSGAKMETGNAG